MSQDTESKTGAEAPWAEWARMTSGFVTSISQMLLPHAGKKTDVTPGEGQKTAEKKEAAGPAPGNWMEWAMALQSPAGSSSFFLGLDKLPQVLAQRTESRWDQFLGLQNQWLQKIAEVGARTKAFSFDHVDQSLLALWNDIYDKEIRKYLQVPSIGLTRFYQERAARFVDSFNVFLNAQEAFSHVLSEPIEQASTDMGRQMEEMAGEGRIPQDPHEVYNLWIKVLEGRYMTLFKSERYGQVMGRTVDALGNFVEARKALLQDLMQVLPVATERDTRDLYQEIHLLNRRVKELTRRLETLEAQRPTDPRRKPHGSVQDPRRSHHTEAGRRGGKGSRHPSEGP